MRKGFTLIELIVVIAVFGILALAGTDLIISAIRNSNRSYIENEVRQNAQKILTDIVNEARKTGATAGNLNTIYKVVVDGNSNRVLQKNNVQVSANSVSVKSLTISGSPAISIVLEVEQRVGGFTQQDFQGYVKLTESVIPRKY